MNPTELVAAELQTLLVAELARRIEVEPEAIDPRQPLERYGVDSLNAIKLAVELEARIGFKLPTTLLWDYPSIEGIANYLAAELNVRKRNQLAAEAHDPG
jgi:acyl carrier protein